MHELSEFIDDRAHHSYKILWELRNNASWGHLPPNTEMFDFFDSIKTHTGTVHNILEFGTNVGFSSMIQLQVNPEASITSFDISKVSLKYARTQLNPLEGNLTQGMPLDLSELETISSQALLSILYGKRFHYKISSSTNIMKYPSLCSRQWGYVFVDGGHEFGEAIADIDNSVYKLHTDFILVDNMLLSPVKRAAEVYVEKGVIEPIAEHTYHQNRYRRESGFDGSSYSDKLVLFKKKI